MPVSSLTQGLVRIATLFTGAVCLAGWFRFPGLASQHGGGAFFVAYAVSLFVIGWPLFRVVRRWAEVGEAEGCCRGFAAVSTLSGSRWGKCLILTVLCLSLFVVIVMTLLGAWCLAYAWKSATGQLVFSEGGAFVSVFATFVGSEADGALWKSGADGALPWLAGVVALVFLFLHRRAARWLYLLRLVTLPVLVILAGFLLWRVLMLGVPDPANPSRSVSVSYGLGFFFEPVRVVLEERPAGQAHFYRGETLFPHGPPLLRARAASVAAPDTFRIAEIGPFQALADPRLWLAAVGQVCFAFVVAMGASLAARPLSPSPGRFSLNGLASGVSLGGGGVVGSFVTVPAASALFGGIGAVGGTFGLPFLVLPFVFDLMPGGSWWGALFFFLLFLSALSVSVALLRFLGDFLREALGIQPFAVKALLFLLLLAALGPLSWFTHNQAALAQMDFWVGTVGATLGVFLFILSGALRHGIPDPQSVSQRTFFPRLGRFFGFLATWSGLAFLLVILGLWTAHQGLGLVLPARDFHLDHQVGALFGSGDSRRAWFGLLPLFLILFFFALVLKTSKRYCPRPVKN